MAESLFTPAAAGVFRLAQEQALRLGHSYVGSEHLLLALSQGQGDPACAALNRAGAPPQALREALAAGYTEPWQLADYFDLPQQDIEKALHYRQECQGIDFNA